MQQDQIVQEQPAPDVNTEVQAALAGLNQLEASLVALLDEAMREKGVHPFAAVQSAMIQGAQLLVCLVADSEQATPEAALELFDKVVDNIRQKIVVEKFDQLREHVEFLHQAAVAREAAKAAEGKPE